jgi:hypothetical protein
MNNEELINKVSSSENCAASSHRQSVKQLIKQRISILDREIDQLHCLYESLPDLMVKGAEDALYEALSNSFYNRRGI